MRFGLAMVWVGAACLVACGSAAEPDAGPPDAGPPGLTIFPARDFACPAGQPPPCATTEPTSTDADRSALEPNDLGGTSVVFVLDRLRIERRGSPVETAGFNVDLLDSGEGAATGTCEEIHADYRSIVDPRHVGVDNALVELAAPLESFIDREPCRSHAEPLNCTLLEQINAGSILLLVEVTGVDSFDHDSSVSLQLYRGTATAALEIGADGFLAPGQTFATEALGAPVDGDVFGGRLRATVPMLDVMLSLGDTPFPWRIYDVEVRFDLLASGITNGALGGTLTVDDLVESANMIMPGLDVRSIIESYADVEPDADPTICRRLAIGLGLQGVPAVRR